MKAITTIITIMLFVLSNNSTQAQTSVTKEFLKSKTWVINEHFKATIRFTDTEIIYYLEDNVLTSQKYHLSDKNCIDASYDPARVGLVSKGNYIFYEKNNDCAYIKFVNISEFKIGFYSPTNPKWTVIVAKS